MDSTKKTKINLTISYMQPNRLSTIGIAVLAWNRPDYLRATLQALAKNNLDDTEIHLFLDGHICKFTGNEITDKTLVDGAEAVFKKVFPDGTVHRRKHNVSIAINQYDAMRYMCDNYKSFLFTEDDVVVSPHWLDIVRVLRTQYANNSEVACISPSFRLYCDTGDKEKHEDKLIVTGGHFWNELIWSEKWREVTHWFDQYYQHTKDRPYKQRNHGAIHSLFREYDYDSSVTSQDAGKDWAIKASGKKRLRLVVNRATGIGDYGYHSTPDKLKKFMDGHNDIWVSDSELKIKKFALL